MKPSQEKLQALEAEFQTHARIMDRIRDVKGSLGSYFYINGYYYYWTVSTLKDEELKEIAERKNHEELMLLIHQYGKAAPEPNWNRHLVSNPYYNLHILPDYIQELIATRCNFDEIAAYTHYQGFGLAGQKAFFENSSRELKKFYITRHGFLPEVQEMLKATEDTELINIHIQKHGMSTTWEQEVIKSSDFEHFKSCVNMHEFSVPGQQFLCEHGTQEQQLYYIDKYGFWFDAHPYLINHCSNTVVYRYIVKHRHLSYEGEIALCKKGNHDMIMHYIDNRCLSDMMTFVHAEYNSERANYIEILAAFKKACMFTEYNKTEVLLVTSNHQDEIMEHISHNKPCLEAVIALLKSENTEAKKLYYQKWE